MDLRAKCKIPPRFNRKDWVTGNIATEKGTRSRSVTNKRKQTGHVAKRLSKKKCPDNREVDKYCWSCHTFGFDKVCSQCPRVYHSNCLKDQNSFNDKDECPECQLTSLTGDEEWSSDRLNELLMYAIDQVFDKRKQINNVFFDWPENEKNQELFYKKVDADFFCQKLNAGCYKKPVEFLSDVKWLYHNAFIVYGEKSKIALAAAGIVKRLYNELCSLEACDDCYFYRHSKAVEESTFFAQPCSKYHEVIWAKVKGFTYWPAKCLKVKKSGSAFVVFFGTHEIASVPVSDWFSVNSQQTIAKSRKVREQEQYCSAIVELFSYHEKIKEQHNISESLNRLPVEQLSKETQTSSEEKQSKETQTSSDYQNDFTNCENGLGPEILYVTSINQTVEDSDGIGDSDAVENPVLLTNESVKSTTDLPASDSTSFSKTFSEEDDCIFVSDDEDVVLLSLPKNPKKMHQKSESPGKTNSNINHVQSTQNGCAFNQLSSLFDSVSNSNSIFEQAETSKSENSSYYPFAKRRDPFAGCKQTFSSKITAENPYFSESNYNSGSDDFKLDEASVKNLDTATLAKYISSKDAQFSTLFDKKAKDLYDAMMVHVWAKTHASSTQITPDARINSADVEKNFEKEAYKVKQRLLDLEKHEEELKNCRNKADFLRDQFFEQQNKMLGEINRKLDHIKTEKFDIEEKYYNFKN